MSRRPRQLRVRSFPDCGGEFCQGCGHGLAAAPAAQKFCGHCGTPLTGARFCSECGTPAS